MRQLLKKTVSSFLLVAILSGIIAANMTSSAMEQSDETEHIASYSTMTLESREMNVNESEADTKTGAITPQARLYINDVEFIEACFLIEDTTYVPLRAFSENLGECEIGWDNGVASVKTDDLDMDVQQGSHYIEANGRYIYQNGVIRNIDSRIYVPVRSLAKAYSLEVIWEDATKSVRLVGDPKGLKRAEEYYDEEDLYWLSRIIHAESSGEPLLGKIAVGNVVMNRVRRSDYPNTVYGVVFDKKYGTQFSPVAYGTIYNTPSAESIKAAKICLDGYSVNDEIIFFINPRIATNFWITNTRTFVTKIGNHSFYK